MSERDSAIKADFRAIEAAISVVRTMGNMSLIFKLLILLQVQYGLTRDSKTTQQLASGPVISYPKLQHILSKTWISK